MSTNKLSIYAEGGCSGGSCPTVYTNAEGKFYVQGYIVPTNISSNVTLGENELLVEVSPELIAAISKSSNK